MRWIRVLIYDGPEQWIRESQGRAAMPDGIRTLDETRTIRSVTLMGGRCRALVALLRELLRPVKR